MQLLGALMPRALRFGAFITPIKTGRDERPYLMHLITILESVHCRQPEFVCIPHAIGCS